MKHCILVKLTAEGKENLPGMFPDIRNLFIRTLEIPGIEAVEFKENCIERPNRSDLLIMMTMEKEALPVYDTSEAHLLWKRNYSKYIESKAIFDFEE